jgi:hypothetical protein
MTKKLACVSLVALAITLQPAFAQTATAPAPSPLHSTPSATPAPMADPSTTQQQQKKHTRHSHRQGATSTGAPGSQGN